MIPFQSNTDLTLQEFNKYRLHGRQIVFLPLFSGVKISDS